MPRCVPELHSLGASPAGNLIRPYSNGTVPLRRRCPGYLHSLPTGDHIEKRCAFLAPPTANCKPVEREFVPGAPLRTTGIRSSNRFYPTDGLLPSQG